MTRITHTLTTLLLAAAVSASAWAQDKLITKEGDVIQGWDIEIGQTAIFYRTAEAEDAAMKKVAKDEILMVKYADGRKLMIGDESANTPAKKEEVSPLGNASNPEANKAAKERFNSPVPEYINGKTSSKAGSAIVLFGLTEDSEIADDNVELEFANGNMDAELSNKAIPVLQSYHNYTKYTLGLWLQVIIRNKTNKLVFVDLGSSFISRNGESEAYYRPEATSTTQGTTNGGGISVHGISLGGSKTNVSSTTVFSQRIVSVPPKSTLALDGKFVYYSHEKEIGLQRTKIGQLLNEYERTISDEGKYVSSGMMGTYLTLNFGKDSPLMVGEHLTYSEDQVKDRTEFTITYSFSEDFSTQYLLQPKFYFKDIIGYSWKSGTRENYLLKNFPGIAKYFGITMDCSSTNKHPVYPRP